MFPCVLLLTGFGLCCLLQGLWTETFTKIVIVLEILQSNLSSFTLKVCHHVRQFDFILCVNPCLQSPICLVMPAMLRQL